MNMNLKKSKIPKRVRLKIMKHFVAGTTARTAAELLNLNRNTVRLFFHRLRVLITEKQNANINFSGEIEVDESYFGGKRKVQRGRGAAGKVPVFGLLKLDGKAYAEIISDIKSETLIPIIKEKVIPDSIVYTDCFKSYNALDV